MAEGEGDGTTVWPSILKTKCISPSYSKGGPEGLVEVGWSQLLRQRVELVFHFRRHPLGTHLRLQGLCQECATSGAGGNVHYNL